MTSLCGSRFAVIRNCLAALNILYLLIGIILIAVGAYAMTAGRISSLSIIGGIVAAGVLLSLVSLLGLFGTCKHHQVILFFYMIVLFMIFLVQFCVAIACLAMNRNQRQAIAVKDWLTASTNRKKDVQNDLRCCGYPLSDNASAQDVKNNKAEIDSCRKTCPNCGYCDSVIDSKMGEGLRVAGGIGLFFSFTEIVGIWMAMRYRNMKDPRANPNNFL